MSLLRTAFRSVPSHRRGVRLTAAVAPPGPHRGQRRAPGPGPALGSGTPRLSLAHADTVGKPDGVPGGREQCLAEGVAPVWSPLVGTAQDRVTSDAFFSS